MNIRKAQNYHLPLFRQTGIAFTGWTGDVAEPDSETTTITITANKTVTATFVEEDRRHPPQFHRHRDLLTTRNEAVVTLEHRSACCRQCDLLGMKEAARKNTRWKRIFQPACCIA
jgi:uncharacterized repeat protein (TIGR02543 family)